LPVAAAFLSRTSRRDSSARIVIVVPMHAVYDNRWKPINGMHLGGDRMRASDGRTLGHPALRTVLPLGVD